MSMNDSFVLANDAFVRMKGLCDSAGVSWLVCTNDAFVRMSDALVRMSAAFVLMNDSFVLTSEAFMLGSVFCPFGFSFEAFLPELGLRRRGRMGWFRGGRTGICQFFPWDNLQGIDFTVLLSARIYLAHLSGKRGEETGKTGNPALGWYTLVMGQEGDSKNGREFANMKRDGRLLKGSPDSAVLGCRESGCLMAYPINEEHCLLHF
jgi:hypothetical protein